jgi:hypothetical protein
MDRNSTEFTTSLQYIADTAGYDTRSYSGRGMYGEECLAVTLEVGQTPFRFFADMLDQVASLVSSGMNGEETDHLLDAISSLEACLRSAQTDSMGRGTVVYFPGTKYVEDGHGEEEEAASSSETHPRYGSDY